MQLTFFPSAVSGSRFRSGTRARAGVKLILLVVLGFLLGLAAGGFAFFRATRTNTPPAAAGLSDGTIRALKALGPTVEIRFYSLLDRATVSPAWNNFAGRVARLVAEYPPAADGKISLAQYDDPSDAASASASADGIKPFNLDRGEACYLGIAVSCNGRTESLPPLTPDWEPALEFDLTRAILRVAEGPAAPAPSGETVKREAAATEQVKRLIPDMNSATLEQGTQILRTAALADFQAAAGETTARLQAAQERLAQAQAGQSASEQQAALTQLQQVQSEQSEKLKEIAARAEAQITAWTQLKQAAK